MSQSNTWICVGDGEEPFQQSQTDLQGSNKFRKQVDVGYPIIEGPNKVRLRATFETTEAAFPWREWGVANAAVDGVLMNRLVEYNGIKLPDQKWVIEVTLELILT